VTFEHLAARLDGAWLDFAADVGDGGRPTYAVARLLAAPRCAVRDPRGLLRRALIEGAGVDGGGADAASVEGVAFESAGTEVDAGSGGASAAGAVVLLPRGAALVLGGDLAYPNPTDATYERRLHAVYGEALPPPPWFDPATLTVRKPDLPWKRASPGEAAAADESCDPRSSPFLPAQLRAAGGGAVAGAPAAAALTVPDAALLAHPGPQCFCLPGNHDWLDGLATFQRRILQRGWLGGWLLPQAGGGSGGGEGRGGAGYFALRLPGRWWLLALDTALEGDLDPGQFRYFSRLARERIGPDPDARVIVVTHEPTWLTGWMDGGGLFGRSRGPEEGAPGGGGSWWQPRSDRRKGSGSKTGGNEGEADGDGDGNGDGNVGGGGRKGRSSRRRDDGPPGPAPPRRGGPGIRQLLRGPLRGRVRLRLAGDLHFYTRHSMDEGGGEKESAAAVAAAAAAAAAAARDQEADLDADPRLPDANLPAVPVSIAAVDPPHLVCCGGGGAFSHPTHPFVRARPRGLASARVGPVVAATSSAAMVVEGSLPYVCRASFPHPRDSRALLKGLIGGLVPWDIVSGRAPATTAPTAAAGPANADATRTSSQPRDDAERDPGLRRRNDLDAFSGILYTLLGWDLWPHCGGGRFESASPADVARATMGGDVGAALKGFACLVGAGLRRLALEGGLSLAIAALLTVGLIGLARGGGAGAHGPRSTSGGGDADGGMSSDDDDEGDGAGLSLPRAVAGAAARAAAGDEARTLDVDPNPPTRPPPGRRRHRPPPETPPLRLGGWPAAVAWGSAHAALHIIGAVSVAAAAQTLVAALSPPLSPGTDDPMSCTAPCVDDPTNPDPHFLAVLDPDPSPALEPTWRRFRTAEERAFPDPTGVRADLSRWSFGLYPSLVRLALAAVDAPVTGPAAAASEVCHAARRAATAAASIGLGPVAAVRAARRARRAALAALPRWPDLLWLRAGALALTWLPSGPLASAILGLYLFASCADWGAPDPPGLAPDDAPAPVGAAPTAPASATTPVGLLARLIAAARTALPSAPAWAAGGLHHDEAFSALRVADRKSFLRRGRGAGGRGSLSLSLSLSLSPAFPSSFCTPPFPREIASPAAPTLSTSGRARDARRVGARAAARGCRGDPSYGRAGIPLLRSFLPDRQISRRHPTSRRLSPSRHRRLSLSPLSPPSASG